MTEDANCHTEDTHCRTVDMSMMFKMSLEEDSFEDGVSPKRIKPNSIETDLTRLSGRHFLAENLPSKKRKVASRRCVLCYKEGTRKETSYRCKTCPWSPALCVIPCFEKYHTLLDITHGESSAMPKEELTNLSNDSNPTPVNPVNYDMSRFAELELLSLRKELILEEAKEKKREHDMRMEILAMQRQFLLQEAEDKRREHEMKMRMLSPNDVRIIKEEGT